MPLDPKLRAAYEATDYVVFAEPELVIRIGEPNPDLDALMESAEASSAAFLTAANPDGELQSDAENRAALDELRKAELLRFRPQYDGEGRDPLGKWPAEPSLLVVGISRDDAVFIGLSHAQNAIVFVEKGQAPELVVLV